MKNKKRFLDSSSEFLLIVENFFDDPQKIREIALSKFSEFGKTYSLINDAKKNYPGVRIDVGTEISNDIEKKLTLLLGKGEIPKLRSAMFSLTMDIHGHGVFHTDGNIDFAGVIYLNEKSPQGSGTLFYDFNIGPKLMDKLDFEASVKGYAEKIFNSNTSQNAQYIQSVGELRKELTDKYTKKTIEVENKFNRMIFYNSNIFHAPGKAFGSDIQDSRLAIILAFSLQDRQKSILPDIFRRFSGKNA